MGRARQEILDGRARELARRQSPGASEDPAMRVVEFTIGAGRYAVESVFAAEVVPVGPVTPLARAGALLVGVTNVRGRILPVVDLRALVDAPGAHATGRYLVVLRNGGAELAILADEILSEHGLAREQIQGPLPALCGRRRELLRCVTADGLAVLDPERVLALDPGNGGMA